MRGHKRSQVVDGVKTVSGLLGKDSLLPGRWCMCGKPVAKGEGIRTQKSPPSDTHSGQSGCRRGGSLR